VPSLADADLGAVAASRPSSGYIATRPHLCSHPGTLLIGETVPAQAPWSRGRDRSRRFARKGHRPWLLGTESRVRCVFAGVPVKASAGRCPHTYRTGMHSRSLGSVTGPGGPRTDDSCPHAGRHHGPNIPIHAKNMFDCTIIGESRCVSSCIDLTSAQCSVRPTARATVRQPD